MGEQMPDLIERPRTQKRFSLFRAPKIVRRFRKDEEGVTAIEFAMLALPFFALMMAIIETSIFFFAGQVLESSVDDVARKIRTGQLDSSLTAADLRDEICDSAAVLFTCGDLLIDMQVVAKYEDLGDMPGPDGGELKPGDFGFEAAGPKQIVMVTVASEWPIFTNYLQQYMSKLNSKNALLTAVAVFKTEPYS